MKRLLKIKVHIIVLAMVLAFAGIVRSDRVSIITETASPAVTYDTCAGYIIPIRDSRQDPRRDTGAIYADTPQFATPRNTSVSGQTRQHTTAKRTSSPGIGEATLKDGKVITRYTFINYFSYITLFPSGLWDCKTKFLSLRKLII